jgi:4-hydroxy-tetrahydrodipicolinate reductase
MKVALLGYGKMGKAIERILVDRGHSVSYKIDINNKSERELINHENTDVLIEFSSPHAAFENIKFCMEKGFKVVCGTTGWLEHREEVEELCKKNKGSFFYASNYSIGVNLFFKVNAFLAKLMSGQSQYEICTYEIHHTEKLDAPSGTAISLAEGIIKNNSNKETWVNNEIPKANEVGIWSSREGKVPGTHSVKYISAVDEIDIKHTAYSREGFALGAVVCAEWLSDKTGVFGMEDMLKF